MTDKSVISELWLARRANRPHLFAIGTTTRTQRMELTRRAIQSQQLAGMQCGMQGAHRITFAEAFERLYGEPLEAISA